MVETPNRLGRHQVPVDEEKKMAPKTVIASRSFLARDQSGREFKITVSVGEPVEIESGDWMCPLSIDGLHEHLDARGGDSWQAIQLAFLTIESLLKRFIRKGGVLLWPEDQEPMEIEELFPNVPGTLTDQTMVAAEAFVARRFELGPPDEVIVRWDHPVADGNDFRCDYKIVWPNRTHSSKAMGVDAVQALTLAMEKAHIDLLASDEGKHGQLRWLGAEELSLPLPPSMTPKDFKSKPKA